MIEKTSRLEFEEYPSLKAFFGANGVLTGEIESSDEFRELCWSLFEVKAGGDKPMTWIENQIKALGKAKRRVMVRKNLKHLPARLVSQKKAHQRKRAGVFSKRDKEILEKMKNDDRD